MEHELPNTVEPTTISQPRRVKQLNLLSGVLGCLASIYLIVVGSKLFADDYEPVTLLAPQPTIVNAPTRLASEVGDDLGPTELVIGVTLDGVSRAYPINMLTGPSREIINDTLGGTAIAATW